MAAPTLNTVVAGAGWAGLSAAVRLGQAGMPVTLLEASRQLGGRARSIVDGEWHIDNGQHMLLGAYHQTLKLFDTLGVPERKMVRRKLFELEMRSPAHGQVRLRVPNVAGPVHILWGLMRARGLDLQERGTAMRLGARLIRSRFTIAQDQPLEKWLLQHGQTRRLIQTLWQPLCLAMLNTPIREASTKVFLHILRKTFARERDDSDLLFIRPPLSATLPGLTQDFIQRHNGEIQLNQRITGLAIEQNRLHGIYVNQSFRPCEQLILATPPWTTRRLLAEHEATQPISQALERLDHHPICTVYLQYPDTASLGTDFIGLVDSLGHWVFDRCMNGQPGLMAVVICGPGPHMDMDNAALADQLIGEMARLYPHWPQPINWRIIREKRATFGCRTGIERFRPSALTPVEGLFLAGDYLDTGYPSTLEGAVKSGLMSARALLEAPQTTAPANTNSPTRAAQ